MSKGLFITGTDTDVGKTTIALRLVDALKKKGLRVAVMKPVSAGCEQTTEGLRNKDAEMLMEQCSFEVPYEIVNPYAFEPAIAPHIAAAEAGVNIDIEHIQDCYNKISEQADIVIVEGAGGWMVPINDSETMADLTKALSLDVITVVGIRLGCLNHALLTTKAIDATGLVQHGWIANHLSAITDRAKENVDALRSRIPEPFLDEVSYGLDSINLENSVQVIADIYNC